MSALSLCVSRYPNQSFAGSEIWNVENGRVTHQGKTSVLEDPLDTKATRGSGTNTPIRSRLQTPVASASATPAASGAEDAGGAPLPVVKKKKLTRNQSRLGRSEGGSESFVG